MPGVSAVTSGSSLPTNCNVGNLFIKTGADAGLYVCFATNTWTGPAAISTLPVLTADPSSPVDDTAWIRRTGSSPTQEIELRCCIGGAVFTLIAVTR